MKVKRLLPLLAVLFALGCGDEWNPVAPPSPMVNQGGGDGPECNERLYPGNPVPPHCRGSGERTLTRACAPVLRGARPLGPAAASCFGS